jgi:hypothetical protein
MQNVLCFNTCIYIYVNLLLQNCHHSHIISSEHSCNKQINTMFNTSKSKKLRNALYKRRVSTSDAYTRPLTIDTNNLHNDQLYSSSPLTDTCVCVNNTSHTCARSSSVSPHVCGQSSTCCSSVNGFVG